jgi:hypothetical protein
MDISDQKRCIARQKSWGSTYGDSFSFAWLYFEESWGAVKRSVRVSLPPWGVGGMFIRSRKWMFVQRRKRAVDEGVGLCRRGFTIMMPGRHRCVSGVLDMVEEGMEY